ncbi:MAG: hypothetical protein ACJZ5X_05625 [Opitutales bacterium]
MRRSKKKYTVAVSLSGIFGLLGIHHFYLGRWFHGLIDLSMTISGYYLAFLREDTILIGFLILGVDIIHTFIVTILLLIGNYKDGDGDYITYPGQILKQN